MIVWREKFTAFAIHFLVTLSMAACAAALIFLVWYPDPFQTMLGGWKLFGLVVGCDLALGPLISLVIYNSKKSRRELVLDYAIVGAVQLAALVYGVYMVSNSRPVYVAFVKDRLEVITASEIDDEDLKSAPELYRSRPKWRPQLVGTAIPPGAEEHNKAVFLSLAGKDLSVLPRYYVTYESQLGEIKSHAQSLETLKKHHPAATELVTSAVKKLAVAETGLTWLPVKHKRGFWTALIDTQTGRPVGYLDFDPYD